MNNAGITLITGGASGVGLLLAKKLAAAGDTVAVADVNPLPDGEVAGVSAFICDLSDHEATEALA